MEPPHLVERLPLALPSEDDHDGEELDCAVAVEAPGAGAGLDRAPTAGDEVEAPEVGPLLEVGHPAEDPHGGVVEDGGVAVARRGGAALGAALGHQVPGLAGCGYSKRSKIIKIPACGKP